MLYNSIYFKLKKRQKRKPACIVSEVRIEFTSVLENINWKEARGILPGYGSILCIDLGHGYVDMYICKNP